MPTGTASSTSPADTLIGDAGGIHHPALFNDRLLLGLKGTMSEAESHVLRARLNGGIRNKPARGELRRGLPVGFVWGEADGEVLLSSRRGGRDCDPHSRGAAWRATDPCLARVSGGISSLNQLPTTHTTPKTPSQAAAQG
jgi:hypothetical protein